MSAQQQVAISLNTDIGEGFGVWTITDDDRLLELVSDANLACGFHAGDPDIIRATCATAARLGVAVGAQVGYADLRGFGRRVIDVPAASITNDIVYQVGAVRAFCEIEGLTLSYVKIHGALYHAAVQRPDYHEALADAITLMGADLPVMCQPGTSLAATLAARGCRTIREGYLDRAYRADGLLVPRSEEGAMVVDPEVVAARAVQFAVEGTVRTIEGETIAMEVDSLCIHSDSPGAIELAAAARQALDAAGIEVRGIGATAANADQ